MSSARARTPSGHARGGRLESRKSSLFEPLGQARRGRFREEITPDWRPFRALAPVARRQAPKSAQALVELAPKHPEVTPSLGRYVVGADELGACGRQENLTAMEPEE